MTVLLAVRAIGQASLGEARAELLGFTVGLLLTFLAVRVNTRLIRARVSWWFHDLTPGDTHIHHMVFGVIIMVATGLITFGLGPAGLTLQLLAFFFGAGVALTLDEFALILHLEDVYWLERGRISVDAVVVVAAAGALSLMIGPPLVGSDVGRSSFWSLTLIAVLNLGCALIAVAKGKLWTGFLASGCRSWRSSGPFAWRARARPGRGRATRSTPRSWREPRPARRTATVAGSGSRSGSTT